MATSAAQDFAPRHLLANLLDFVFPPKCQVCEKHFSGDNIWLCPDCRFCLEISFAPVCLICRQPQTAEHHVCPHCRTRSRICWLYALGGYEGAYSSLIKAFKYDPKPGIGGLLGELLAQKLAALEQCESLDVICPVPLHLRKQRARGFNQAEVLANVIGEHLDLPVLPDALQQVRRAKDQIGLTLEQRFANVDGVFAVSADLDLVGANVLLVDDVTTSGATLNDAARALKAAGAASVAAATVAVSYEEGIDFELASRYLTEHEFGHG